MAANRYEQNEEFFVKLFSESDMMNQIVDILSSVLYEKLNKQMIYKSSLQQSLMVAEGELSYEEK